MLCEHEEVQLLDLVDAYGLKGIVDALATIADNARLRVQAENHTPGTAWGHDAAMLRSVVPKLCIGGKGKS